MAITAINPAYSSSSVPAAATTIIIVTIAGITAIKV